MSLRLQGAGSSSSAALLAWGCWGEPAPGGVQDLPLHGVLRLKPLCYLLGGPGVRRGARGAPSPAGNRWSWWPLAPWFGVTARVFQAVCPSSRQEGVRWVLGVRCSQCCPRRDPGEGSSSPPTGQGGPGRAAAEGLLELLSLAVCCGCFPASLPGGRWRRAPAVTVPW